MGHGPGEEHTGDKQSGAKRHDAADAVPVSHPPDDWAEESRGYPLNGERREDGEDAPAKDILEVGHQYRGGKSYCGGSHPHGGGHGYHDPGVMDLSRSDGQVSRPQIDLKHLYIPFPTGPFYSPWGMASMSANAWSCVEI